MEITKTAFIDNVFKKLEVTDWIALRHASGEDQNFAAGYEWAGWASYRQGLRDIINSAPNMPEVVDPHAVDWPLRPTVPALWDDKFKPAEYREWLKKILVEDYGKDLANYPNL